MQDDWTDSVSDDSTPTRWKRIEEKCPKCGHGSRSNGSRVIRFEGGQAGLRVDFRVCSNPEKPHRFTISYGVVPVLD